MEAASRARRTMSPSPPPTRPPASWVRRRRTISARCWGSVGALTSTESPKRSSSCGRSSPSSGFMEPTRTKRAACEWDTPSRPTQLTPEAATSSSTSTTGSGRRLTSSTYRTPPFAAASRPGRNAAAPSWGPGPASAPGARTALVSIVPTTVSSVAPSGSSTKGAPPGSIPARPRASVDLAAPLSPRRSTPPMSGSTAARRRASRASPCPTTALNGNRACAVIVVPWSLLLSSQPGAVTTAPGGRAGAPVRDRRVARVLLAGSMLARRGRGRRLAAVVGQRPDDRYSWSVSASVCSSSMRDFTTSPMLTMPTRRSSSSTGM